MMDSSLQSLMLMGMKDFLWGYSACLCLSGNWKKTAQILCSSFPVPFQREARTQEGRNETSSEIKCQQTWAAQVNH